ncbi:MAG: hypothetical protein KZQ64_09595 [gamma proteobacterium symbiont of Bathyaustriella thionipta]|nr:hypothetical protein [gamma proteobacterium symbiont of Bathyaustriella thionipta]MCU7951450.1 hypothetical protein [gamma proteobacterium symbiont of Bathyaustriella thionipta]MCU7953628.1 hypothetical protein [gamma proteobacterium symbiont of Bathyaustriella thionipta]MCU7958018.1 hypothetical protein [gamma proteobacterium symbiont of Bathyaustriella thionipta]MCU7968533.1 hypothetical protein [gamma proteobacterium symbiont of Bathyaustriella thionipta]
MKNYLKAISYGVITIVVLGLFNQLILIMALVGYGSLAKSYSVLLPWTQVFTYTLGGLGYFIVMFFGGLVTTIEAKNHSCSMAFAASILGSSISLYLSLKDEIFTPIAFFFLIFGISSALSGCWVWHKYQQRKPAE